MGLLIRGLVRERTLLRSEVRHRLDVSLGECAVVGEVLAVGGRARVELVRVTLVLRGNRLAFVSCKIAHLVGPAGVCELVFVSCYKRLGWVVRDFHFPAFLVENEHRLLVGRRLCESTHVGGLHLGFVLVTHDGLAALRALDAGNAGLLFTSFLKIFFHVVVQELVSLHLQQQRFRILLQIIVVLAHLSCVQHFIAHVRLRLGALLTSKSSCVFIFTYLFPLKFFRVKQVTIFRLAFVCSLGPRLLIGLDLEVLLVSGLHSLNRELAVNLPLSCASR